MIISGWILPNGEEIVCGRLVNNENHITTIEKYLEYIKKENMDLYQNIQTNMVLFGLSVGHLSLDDFGVYILGWVKVGNYPYRYVQTAGYSFQEQEKEKYLAIGYEDVPPSIILPESRHMKIYCEVNLKALFPNN